MTGRRHPPRFRSGVAALALLAGVAGCGTVGGGSTKVAGLSANATANAKPNPTVATASRATARRHRARPKPSFPKLLHGQPTGPTRFTPMIAYRGQHPIWVSRTPSGAILVSLNQRYLTVRLQSGTTDAGATGWKWGPEVERRQRALLLAAFNGGFMLDTGAGGFESHGRVAVPLRSGLASIVTYATGKTDVGSWDQEVPARGQKVVSVRQNLTLLIDHGRINSNIACIQCWGATLGGVDAPARSALGVTGDGHLIWAGGISLTPLQLADLMLSAHVVRAEELDINPEWVAFDLYSRHSRFGAVTAVPMVPGQQGVPGQFLAPYSRDFFSVEAHHAATATG